MTKVELEDWAKLIKKKYGTKLKMVKSFDNPNILAQFDPNTNIIKYKEGATNYLIAHESFHAEEMYKIGFNKYIENAPLVGVKEVELTNKNLIRRYYREKYVADELIKNTKKLNLNDQELWHIEAYFYEIKMSLIEKNISIPK